VGVSFGCGSAALWLKAFVFVFAFALNLFPSVPLRWRSSLLHSNQKSKSFVSSVVKKFCCLAFQIRNQKSQI
jgi:hypothetical protein